MSVFDEDLFLKGLEQRKSTLGADYVKKVWMTLMISPAPSKRR